MLKDVGQRRENRDRSLPGGNKKKHREQTPPAGKTNKNENTNSTCYTRTKIVTTLKANAPHDTHKHANMKHAKEHLHESALELSRPKKLTPNFKTHSFPWRIQNNDHPSRPDKNQAGHAKRSTPTLTTQPHARQTTKEKTNAEGTDTARKPTPILHPPPPGAAAAAAPHNPGQRPKHRRTGTRGNATPKPVCLLACRLTATTPSRRNHPLRPRRPPPPPSAPRSPRPAPAHPARRPGR